MPAQPWYLAVRVHQRAALTAGGIALCAAFAVLSFTVVSGFEESAYSAEAELRALGWMVHRPNLSPFNATPYHADAVLLIHARSTEGSDILLASLVGPNIPIVPDGAAIPTQDVASPWLNLTAPRALNLSTSLPRAEPRVPAGTFIVSFTTLQRLDPSLSSNQASYVITQTPPEDSVLHAQGLVRTQVPALVPFFQTSAAEVGQDLWLVVAFSGVLVALLTYEFMHIEIQERRRELGIWRALGMRSAGAASILFAQAATLAGAGLITATLASLALSALARRVGPLPFLPLAPQPAVLASVLFALLIASLAGASVPIWRASRASIRESLEARQ